jgi:thiosulfate dehydrogenase [quinone] large subunit
MLVAFVESIKYVGHILPIAFLRIFIGYYYFNQALARLQGDFLTYAYLAEDIRANMPKSAAPDWYKVFLENVVIPNWQYAAVALIVLWFAIGVSYIVGYLVRPFAMIALCVGIAAHFAVGPGASESQTMFLMVLHFTLGWMGAGRCLGIDYYFYKRRRGIWW